jgi:ankyrin repeat protein
MAHHQFHFVDGLTRHVYFYTNGRTALRPAAESGHLDVVERLLVAGADVNVVTVNGYGHQTALQAAAEGGHLDVMERLLVAGADVNAAAASNGGRTALQAAAEDGHLDVVGRLLATGADINAAAGYVVGHGKHTIDREDDTDHVTWP